MTRAEWIHQVLLARATIEESWEDAIKVVVDGISALEKSGIAPWDDAPETARESFVRGTEVGHTEAKKVCAQILQSAGIGALAHHLGIVGWVVEDDAPFAAAAREIRDEIRRRGDT